MRRFADIFIAICIPVVAASAGAVAYFQFEATGRMAAAFALAALVILVLIHVDALRRRALRETEERIGALARRLVDFDGDLESVERRLAAVEDGGNRRHREDYDGLVAEVEVIGSLTRQVIETVADLEVQITEARPVPASRGAQAAITAAAAAGVGVGVPARDGTGAMVPERFAHLDGAAFLELVRSAIEGDRIDLHLQPIVTLPQRKIRFYEALTRLRTLDGETIHASDYIAIAESRGYITTVDEQILLKSVQILRRLTARSKDVGIFLNLSAASLTHADFFHDFVDVLEKNRDLCEMLVLEFPQAAVRAMGPLEQAGLHTLQELGYRFSVDQVSDLRISFQNLADRGFRWVKISADRLLHRADELGTDIHPVDLADYFQRFGMELIADHIEREAEVVDVLDFGVRLGQGFLFAPPRPVRLDVFQQETRPAVAKVETKPAAPAREPATPTAAPRPRTEPAAPVRPVPAPIPPVRTTAAPPSAPAAGRVVPPPPPPARTAAAPETAPRPARDAAAAAPVAASAATRAPRPAEDPAAAREAPRPAIRIIPPASTQSR